MNKAIYSAVLACMLAGLIGCSRHEHYLVVSQSYLYSADSNVMLFLYHFNRDYYDALEKMRVELEDRTEREGVAPAYGDLGPEAGSLDTIIIALDRKNAETVFHILDILYLQKDLADNNVSLIAQGLRRKEAISLTKAILENGRAVKFERYALCSDDAETSIFDAAIFASELVRQKNFSERTENNIEMIQNALDAAGYHDFR